MTLDDKIGDEKPQYDINREASRLSTSSSGKIAKYEEYLTSQEILTSDQRRVTEQAKSAYFPLETAFEKQTKTNEGKGKKQIKSIQYHGKQLIMFNGEKVSLELLKQKEIFNEPVNERRLEINKVNELILII